MIHLARSLTGSRYFPGDGLANAREGHFVALGAERPMKRPDAVSPGHVSLRVYKRQLRE